MHNLLEVRLNEGGSGNAERELIDDASWAGTVLKVLISGICNTLYLVGVI